MLLIKIEPNADGFYHELQERPSAEENWLGDGYLIVPEHLYDAVWECVGCCNLIIEDGELVGITPKERPAPPEPEPERGLTNIQLTELLGMMVGAKSNE
ncbi:MAG: toxin-antitoxin system toxin subunit [Oscillospiraceae bacterium]|nr:toxin-antitoxin system toxin subunit [Oscillospiraceae bacterium]